MLSPPVLATASAANRQQNQNIFQVSYNLIFRPKVRAPAIRARNPKEGFKQEFRRLGALILVAFSPG